MCKRTKRQSDQQERGNTGKVILETFRSISRFYSHSWKKKIICLLVCSLFTCDNDTVNIICFDMKGVMFLGFRFLIKVNLLVLRCCDMMTMPAAELRTVCPLCRLSSNPLRHDFWSFSLPICLTLKWWNTDLNNTINVLSIILSMKKILQNFVELQLLPRSLRTALRMTDGVNCQKQVENPCSLISCHEENLCTKEELFSL